MKELCDPADDDGFMPFKRKSLMTSQLWLILHLNSWIILPKKNIFFSVKKFVSANFVIVGVAYFYCIF